MAVIELPAEQHLQLLQILVHLLPSANVYLLKHLFGLLKRVCDQKETRMTSASLGRLFAHHLLISRQVDPGFIVLIQCFQPGGIFLWGILGGIMITPFTHW